MRQKQQRCQKNKKGKKGGKVTKLGKKGKKSTSPSSSPTGVCEQLLVTRMAHERNYGKLTLAYNANLVSEDPLLSTIEAVEALLNQATSVNAELERTLFGEATGCDYDTSLENYNSALFETYDSTPPQCLEAAGAGRKLEDDPLAMTVKLAQTTPSSEVGRKLEDDPLALLEPILELAQTLIYGFLQNVIQYDKLNKVYPLYMGLLGEITCSYYAMSFAVVDIVKALTAAAGFAYDLSPFLESVLRCELINYEEGDFFPDVFSIPTVFDAAACGL